MSRVSLYQAAPGLLQDSKIHAYISELAYKKVIITDNNVQPLYASCLAPLSTSVLSLPAGEQSKTQDHKTAIENQLFELGCGRDTCLIALGGGVVTDLTGFVAATFCRGVSVVYFPTSLLAMVDAAIGGKNGINNPFGKNLIGTIREPNAIYADLNCLETLNACEFSYGMAEVIKHALIADKAFFEFLEQHASDINARQPDIVLTLINRAAKIKRDIVQHDLHEKGLRQMCNLGHTIAHAIERCTQYKIPHGEAVAIGLLIEALIAKLDLAMIDRLYALINQFNIPLTLTHYHIDHAELLDALQYDKKSRGGAVKFVLLSELGEVKLGCEVNTSVIINALESYYALYDSK